MLLRNKMGKKWISLSGSERGGFALARDLIVTAGRTLVGRGFFFCFPLGGNKLVALETAKCRIHGTAGQTGDLHDIEAEAVAEAKRLEDKSRTMGETRGTHKLCSILARHIGRRDYLGARGDGISDSCEYRRYADYAFVSC
jgi:hypothetical protein